MRALAAFWLSASLTASSVVAVSTLGANASVSDDLRARVCLSGLEQLAAAEKARDASRHEAEVVALQDAIETYDDCIANAQAKGWDTADLEEHLIGAHVYLSDAFYRSERMDDARSQANTVFYALMSLCPRLSKPLETHSHARTSFNAHYYVENLAPRFGLTGAGLVKNACGL